MFTLLLFISVMCLKLLLPKGNIAYKVKPRPGLGPAFKVYKRCASPVGNIVFLHSLQCFCL